MFDHFSVIGAGNLGTHLMHALVKEGYSLHHIFQKSKYGMYAETITDDIELLVQRADFLIIATQESQITGAVERLKQVSTLQGKVIFHTANALTSDVLMELRSKGAQVGSFSPLQTFPPFQIPTGEDIFKGIYFLVEGDEAAIAKAQQISEHLAAHTIYVEKDKKVYFHIAAVAACNFLISILKLSQRQLCRTTDRTTPVDIAVLFPLIYRTLENVRIHGVEASLTGPFKRKESAIIEKHLELLEGEDATLYSALTHYLGETIPFLINNHK